MNIYPIIHTIKNIPRNIKYGIENLIRWFPIIWQDRDWDHYYLYVILHHKLKRMEHLHIHYSHLLSASQTAAQLKLCGDLLERLMKDEYFENASIEYDKKWGETKFDWIPVDSVYSNLNLKQKHVNTEKEKKEEIKHFRRVCNHEKVTRKQDVEYLFKYMSKHVEGWWD